MDRLRLARPGRVAGEVAHVRIDDDRLTATGTQLG